MIISVSGRMGSGKDTVGSIIQIVSASPNLVGTGIITPELVKKFQETRSQDLIPDPKDFQIKKFADKLKDITCIILGCTREQLEDREYKEKPLDKVWWKYKLVGKDFANSQGLNSSYYNIKYLSSKEECEEVAGLSGLRDYEINLDIMTPRKIMQLLGTEAGRQVIHPQIWINSMFSEYRRSVHNSKSKPSGGQSVSVIDAPYPNWVITDTRFPNELQAVKDRDGITIIVKRQETDHLAGDHASETSLDNSKFDYTINNDGTVEELIEKVRDILLDRGII